MTRLPFPLSCTTAALLLLTSAAAATAQPTVVIVQPPACKDELLVGASLWNFVDDVPGRSLSARYIRNIVDEIGVEGGIDVGGASGNLFGLATAQVRAEIPSFDMPGKFVTFGLAAALPSDRGEGVPRGAGWLIGAGLQPRTRSTISVRMELQVLVFNDDQTTLRIMLGFVKGRR
jgi:hypothetical protein